MLKPAIIAYIISADAAPTPEMNPDLNPLFNVLWIHRTPIGPSGADTDIPIKIPFIIYVISKGRINVNYKKIKKIWF